MRLAHTKMTQLIDGKNNILMVLQMTHEDVGMIKFSQATEMI